jgi:hypothetical protein
MVQVVKSSNRQRKQSIRLVRKGALVSETFAIFREWNLDKTIQENLQRVRETNPIGARSQGWLREVVVTLSSRFSTAGSIKPLVTLAKAGIDHPTWTACLFWHIGATDELYYRFATEWLFEQYVAGTYLIQTSDVIPFVHTMTDGKIASGGNLSEYGVIRTARDLLRMAADLGLLTNTNVRHFTSYHLPEIAFMYLLHELSEREANPLRIINSLDWRLYLMSPQDVERELLRLHQYRKVHYEVAGSIVQLKLPYPSAIEYVKGVVA